MTGPASPPPLVPLIVGQVCLHSCMAGLRLAVPLQALRDGRSEGTVGVLLALFALAPIALALAAGRLADRHGYHRPLGVAVCFTTAGGLCALASTFASAGVQFALLVLASVLAGAGANVGLIAIQRTAGRGTSDPTVLKRVFSWLGLAPAAANMVGPLLAGTLIDLGGFRVAFAALALLPLGAMVVAKRVPREKPAARPDRGQGSLRSARQLLAMPGFARLLAVNWLLSACWDVHTFVLPIIGHERGLSASAIGLVLGVFAVAVAGVRLAIPLVAGRLPEGRTLATAMLLAGLVFGIYPLMRGAASMALCAAVLGFALGAVQPMIMSTLHQITPHDRHGEAIALRSMAINASSTLMPLLFGAAGAAVGAASLFWMMGSAVALGSYLARRVGVANAPT